jgi:ribosome-associated protein
MSRKSKKGYFVCGEFVPEGSDRDLALKAQLKGTDTKSRTDQKRESTELQKLGVALLTLRSDALARLTLPDKLTHALQDAKHITNFEGKRRQLQFIGKLMRLLEPKTIDAVRTALDDQVHGFVAENKALHQAELWRDRLLADDQAVSQWIAHHPGTDTQQLRALIRQARKDAVPDNAGSVHHGRAYRELFLQVRLGLRLGLGLDAQNSPDGFSVSLP